MEEQRKETASNIVFMHEKKTWYDDEGQETRDRESYVALNKDRSIEAWRSTVTRPGGLDDSDDDMRLLYPTGYLGGVEVHSPTPHYEGQQPLDRPCSYVVGGKCYPDGSSLAFDYIQYDFENPRAMWEYLRGRVERG